MKYFSYGSNMSANRLGKRIRGCKVLGVFQLDAHDLRFHKISKKDGSGKCDAYFTGNDEDFVLGVLYEVSDDEKDVLDNFEGLGKGYDDKKVCVHSDGARYQAVTYIASEIDEGLVPYSWYVRHVIEGAKTANFPDCYIEKLENITSKYDFDRNREECELAIYM